MSTDMVDDIDAAEDRIGALVAGINKLSESSKTERWLVDCYMPAVKCVAGVFAEIGLDAEKADHNARAVLARLVGLNPPVLLTTSAPLVDALAELADDAYCRPSCGWLTEGVCLDGDCCGCPCGHGEPEAGDG